MKILELRFKNLNSLYGEWFIDFTNPEYVSNGIFALTGPTGAGKSTILDAICLALYGATPRLGKITKTSNEAMSRKTGECYAEVVFESQAGRFRCHWEQRRSKKKADGALQHQEHLIYDDSTGKPLEEKKSQVSRLIEEKTGMDFERFTRSILLAQGGFDSFLKADAEKKSEILEQITGTEIYSKISLRVHERQKEERDKLYLLQEETSGIVILDDEREKGVQLELQANEKRELELTTQTTEVKKAIEWLSGIKTLKDEIQALSNEEQILKIENEAFLQNRTRLALGQKAATLDGKYGTLTAVRKQQATDQASLKVNEEFLPQLDESRIKQAACLKAAEQQIIKTKEELKKAAPLIQKIRSLDEKLVEQNNSILEGERKDNHDKEKINSDNEEKIKFQKKRDDAVGLLEHTNQYLQNNSQDEWLVSGFSAIEENLKSLLSKKNEISQKETEIENTKKIQNINEKNLNLHKKQFEDQKKVVDEIVNTLQQENDILSKLLGGKLLREYRTEKETLLRERAFLATISELTDLRIRLEDGKSCPLCGSKEHPFAEGNVPVPDETEKRLEMLSKLIQKADDQESAIKNLQEKETVARNKLNDSEKQVALAESEKKSVERDLSNLTKSLIAVRSEFTNFKTAVLAKLQPMGIEEIPDSNVNSLVESLEERLKKWQAQVSKRSEIDKQISEIDSQLNRLSAVIEIQRTTMDENKKNLDSLKQENEKNRNERKELFGDKNPAEEEHRLNKAIEKAEQDEKGAKSQHDELREQLTSTKSKIETLKNQIGEREIEQKKLESDFMTSLLATDFVDERHFLEARLKNEELNTLVTKAKILDDKKTDLDARQNDRKSRLEAEIQKDLSKAPLEELQSQHSGLEQTLKQTREVIASHKHTLLENTLAKERIKEKQAAIETLKKECHRWEKLHELIGSSNGKKFRNFAQGLTFELMISHANRQLEKMSGRYLLIRDAEEPLELNVIDNDQAGEIRPTKNLSGGESFIVSLSLALGLSKMSSRRVRVDSLFLDEGFGTLDEEALETALEALSGLQQDGKLIGVISHIPGLKDRISTQIKVKPSSGGKSILAGPGCKKIENAG